MNLLYLVQKFTRYWPIVSHDYTVHCCGSNRGAKRVDGRTVVVWCVDARGSDRLPLRFSTDPQEQTMVVVIDNEEKSDDLVKFKEDHFLPSDSDPKRENLLKKIIQVTEAEYDWIRHVKLMLSTNNFSSEVDKELKKLENSIKPPKDLLIYPPGEAEGYIFFFKKISKDDNLFAAIYQIISQIEKIVLQNFDFPEPFRDGLKNLATFYENSIRILCSSNHSKKKEILSHKVSLTGEGVGFYTISQEMALDLISKKCLWIFSTIHKDWNACSTFSLWCSFQTS